MIRFKATKADKPNRITKSAEEADQDENYGEMEMLMVKAHGICPWTKALKTGNAGHPNKVNFDRADTDGVFIHYK